MDANVSLLIERHVSLPHRGVHEGRCPRRCLGASIPLLKANCPLDEPSVFPRPRDAWRVLLTAGLGAFQSYVPSCIICYEACKGVIPAERHRAITKQARNTNHIERFNNTLRQRGFPVWCAKHCRSPKNWRLTSAPSNMASVTTISREQQYDLCSTTLMRSLVVGGWEPFLSWQPEQFSDRTEERYGRISPAHADR